jgi:hypothetical protein
MSMSRSIMAPGFPLFLAIGRPADSFMVLTIMTSLVTLAISFSRHFFEMLGVFESNLSSVYLRFQRFILRTNNWGRKAHSQHKR